MKKSGLPKESVDDESNYSTPSRHSRFKSSKSTKDVPEDYNPPKFVVNTIAYVPSKIDYSSDSSDEELDRSFIEKIRNFNPNDKTTYPYSTFKYLKESKQYKCVYQCGYVKNKDQGNINADQSQELKSTIVRPFLQKLHDTGLDAGEESLRANISVSLGLNGPRSLSSRKNASQLENVQKEFNDNRSDIEIMNEVFFFQWEHSWYHKPNPEENYAKVEYQDVRKFYKQLKKLDKNESRTEEDQKWSNIFRETNELNYIELDNSDDDGTEFNSQVPYGALRDYVKNSIKTKNLVKKLKKNGEGDIYFVSIDQDTLDFNGVFSAYMRIHKEYNAPKVMSTGYEFTDSDALLSGLDERVQELAVPLKVASQLDRMGRVATAKHLPKGVYYPEPNFAIKLSPGKDTIEESFVPQSAKEKAGDPSESPTILRQIFKYLKNDKIVFADDSPIITATPVRIALNKQKKADGTRNPRDFSDDFKERGSPNDQDIKKLYKVGQSHCLPLQWSKFIYMNRGFEIKKGTTIGKFNSLITKIIKYYRDENDEDIDLLKEELETYVNRDDVKGIIKAAESMVEQINDLQNKLKNGDVLSTPSRKLLKDIEESDVFKENAKEEETDKPLQNVGRSMRGEGLPDDNDQINPENTTKTLDLEFGKLSIGEDNITRSDHNDNNKLLGDNVDIPDLSGY